MSKIQGYRELSETEVANINDLKEFERLLLTIIGGMQKTEKFNQRWVSIGKTHIEQGFMALVRSIARPNGE